MNVGATATGVVTSKPVDLGGSLAVWKPQAVACSPWAWKRC